MKVGIITVHSVPNYGAVLQAYALATYLRSTGIDAETIDYRQPQLEAMYRMRWKFPPAINHWLRLRRNDAFVENRLTLSPGRCRSVEEFLPMIKDYDAFITGSDQVWFTGPVQFYDPLYFLDFPAPGKRKISYAASAGGTTDFGEFKPRVRAALTQYDHIGVRDSHTAQLVSLLGPRPPVQVVDPVFLCDFADLLTEPPPTTEPYLLVFGDFSGKLDPALRAIIQATGLKTVVSLQYPCPAATRRIAAPSPTQWLTCFKHAAFVVTSYFHGAAIAAKFSRPFISIPTPGRRIKVATMLDWMSLRPRCFLADPNPSDCETLACQPIDWTIPQQRIAEQTTRSQAFLATALS
jgi:polysaccharide pyruvyl transferase WcaK-like protein